MATRDENRSVVDLITVVVNEISQLFQAEIRLVRAEINEKMSRLANSGALIAAGVVAAVGAVVIILFAIARFLTLAGLPEEWSLLLVGLAAAGLGALLLAQGIRTIRQTNLVPDRTLEQVRADFATVKDQVT